MSIPVMMLWDARLKRTKKFSLMMLFTAWVFVTVAGVLRCAFVLAVSGLLPPVLEIVELTVLEPAEWRTGRRRLGLSRDLYRRHDGQLTRRLSDTSTLFPPRPRFSSSLFLEPK